MVFLSLLLLLFVIWALLDLSYGRKHHLKQIKPRSFPLRRGHFKLYTYGKNLYDDLFTDIQQAQHHIHILFFIVKNDEVSNAFLQLLIKKAKQGIQVRLLLDRMGSHQLSREAIRTLRQHGVSFSFCHKIKFPFLFFPQTKETIERSRLLTGKSAISVASILGKNIWGMIQNWACGAITICALQEKGYKIYKHNFCTTGAMIQLRIY